MPIKYAEVTIVRNLEKASWFTYFKHLVGHENIITNNDTIIILFDDGTVTDTAEYKDANERFEMGPKSYHSGYGYPMYFNKINKNTVFFKYPRVEKNVLKLDFKPIFKDYPNYTTLQKEPSIYNVIYERPIAGDNVFAVAKRKSNLYLLAYDDSYFDKSDIGSFVNYTFIKG
jgi:hypothetical protein